MVPYIFKKKSTSNYKYNIKISKFQKAHGNKNEMIKKIFFNKLRKNMENKLNKKSLY